MGSHGGKPLSELGAAVDTHDIARDPAGSIGREEGNHVTDIVRLSDTLERLHRQREIAARVSPCELGHISLDKAGRHGVDTDSALAKRGGEVRYQRGYSAFRSCIGRKPGYGSMRSER